MPSGHDPMGGYRFSLTTNAKRLRGDHAQTKSESLTAHASRRSRRSLLSMRLLCFNELDLILRACERIVRVGKGAPCAVPTTDVIAILNGGHAEPVIGRAFARPVGFAHPTVADISPTSS